MDSAPPLPASDDPVSDYSGYDFRTTWTGRERTTELERGIVRMAWAGRPLARFLEVGVGFGRLTPAVRALGRSYVGVDLDLPQLRALAEAPVRGARERSDPWFVEANAYHLPFPNGAFDGIVAVRIFHHMGRPNEFLGELARCLAPGGRLLLQYNPKPTIGTLVMDVERGLQPHDRPIAPTTFSGPGLTRLRTPNFPVYVLPAAEVRQAVESAGFVIQREWGTGAEHLQRWLPSLWQRPYRPSLPIAPLLPSRFLVADRPGSPGADPGEGQDPFACPRCACRIQLASGAFPQPCPSCQFEFRVDGRLVRARYVPGEPTTGPSREASVLRADPGRPPSTAGR